MQKNHTRRQRRTKLRLLLLLALTITGFQAGATHFRYGYMFWERDLSYVGNGYKIDFTVAESWRRGFNWSQYAPQVFGANGLPDPGEVIQFGTNFPINWGDGTTQNVTLNVTSVVPTDANPANDIVNGVFTFSHVYQPTATAPVPTSYVAFFEGAARLNAGVGPTLLLNNGGGSFRVESRVTVGNNNDAPVSTLPPIISMIGSSSTPATYQIPASDPNGDVITYSLAPSASFTQTGTAANTQPFPVTGNPSASTRLSVSSTGLLTFNTSGLAVGNQYNAVIRLTDARGAYVHLDVIIRIAANSQAPVFDYSSGQTPADNTSYTIPIGQTLAFNVRATDPDPLDSVTLFGSAIPVGATLTPPLPRLGAKGAANQTAFSWTPSVSQIGSHIIAFTAQDPQGVQTNTSVNVLVTCAVDFTTNVTNVICGQPGSIVVNASGGTTPYAFSKDGGANFVTGTSPFTFSNLQPGTYPVQVREANGCVVEHSTTVNLIPDNASPTITCPTDIVVSATAGVCGKTIVYTTPPASDNCGLCGPPTVAGYSYAGTFGGHKYFLSTTGRTWANANAEAMAAGAHLASITSAEENNFVTTTTSGLRTWIGLNDVATEGTFVWTSGEAVTYTNWEATEPNNSNGGEDFVITNWNNPGRWNDVVGSSTDIFLALMEFDCTSADAAPIRTAGPPSGSFFPVGTTPISYTASDAANNTVSCSFNVIVTDDEAPVVSNCPGNINVTTGPGSVSCGTLVNWLAPTATDNCGTVTTMSTHNPGAFFGLGTTPVTYTFTDLHSQTSTCRFNVTVTDNTPPAISNCPASPVTATTGSRATCDQVVSWTAPTASDNCGGSSGVSTSNSNNPGDVFPVGTTPVIYIFTDQNNNSVTCAFDVVVTDDTPPVPTVASLPTITAECAATVPTPTATDNCSVLLNGTTTNPTSYSSQGTFTILWRYTDQYNNTTSQTQTVIIQDNTPPTITCPPDITHTANAHLCSYSVNPGMPTVSDNCSYSTLSVTGTRSDAQGLNAPYPVGTTMINWSVNDGHGKSASCVQRITITDDENPTIMAPANITMNADAGRCYATITNLGNPTTGDNCMVASVTNNRPASNQYPVGTTTVTWTVMDNHGHSAMADQTITVIDNQDPTITAPVNISRSADAGQCYATIANPGMPTVNDNCAVQSTSDDRPANNRYPVGTTLITWQVMDIHGRSATATQTITVTDNQNPVLTAPANVLACDDLAGNNRTLTAVASDNCAIASASWTTSGPGGPTMGSGLVVSRNFPIGTTTVTWVVRDPSSNSATASTTVTIKPVPIASITASNADAFCNSVYLTANSTVPGATYSWSYTGTPAFSSTAQTIKLGVGNGSGTYSLTVTNAGCPSSPATYNFQKEALASDYILIGLKEVKLHQNNYVMNGSVGATASNGKIKIEKYSTVSSTGAFVKGADLDIDNQAVVPVQISSPAVITLPTMMPPSTASTSSLSNFTIMSNGTYNSNYRDLTVNDNLNVTIGGSLFKKIKIKKGATVTFTSSDMSMENLEIEKDATINYAGNTKVRVADGVKMEKNVNVNAAGKKVTFYVADPDASDDKEKFDIEAGDGTAMIANVYMPSGKMHVHGGGNEGGTFTGLYIAEKIESSSKYITWNSYDCGSTARLIVTPSAVTTTEGTAYGVLVYPNPTTGEFTVQFEKATDPAQVRITDIQGRVIEARNILPAQMPSVSFDLGNKAAGVYLVEVRQGDLQKWIRLVVQ